MNSTAILYWALVFSPAIPFLALSISYRRIVEQKMMEVTQRLSNFENEYARAYGGRKAQRDLKKELESFYDWRTYTVPMLVTCAVSSGLALTGLLYLKVPLGMNAVAAEVAGLNRNVLIAGGGAYLWGLYDILRRHRSADISSTSLHLSWLRIVIAGAVGAAIGVIVQPPIDVFVSLAVASLPIESIKDWVVERANLSVRLAQSSPDQLHLIRGMTSRLRNRLADEDIDSVESLAFADPVRLVFRTNIEWNVILDLIDQATLVHYLGDKTPLLSPKACGAIDMASLYMRLSEGTPEEQQQAAQVICAVAKALNEPDEVARHLGYLLYNDPLVQFIWAHWEAARPWDEDAENDEQTDAEALPGALLENSAR